MGLGHKQANSSESLAYQGRLRHCAGLFATGRFREAAEQYRLLADAATDQPNVAARARANVGGCQFALHQYQPALQSFLAARQLLHNIHDASGVALIDANIASLYGEMGELGAAAQWVESSISRVSGRDRSHLPEMLLQLGVLRGRQGRMTDALASFRKGLDAADAAGNIDLYSRGWNLLGEAYLLRGDNANAEPALLEAYRIRKLNHLSLDASYRSLGRLRREQGDLVSASALLDRAVELSATPRGLVPSWDVYLERGLVRLEQHRLPEAFDDLRLSSILARDWRLSAVATDAAQIGAEDRLDRVSSALVETGNLLYGQTRNPELIRQTFEAAEENRANSLRHLLAGNVSVSEQSPEFWTALNRLQRAEIAALRTGKPEGALQVEDCRAELTRIEASSHYGAFPSGDGLLARVERALPNDAVLFSFHLGEGASSVWAVDHAGIWYARLADGKQIQNSIDSMLRAIRADAVDSAGSAADLYRLLFGAIPQRFISRSRWILSVDKQLFDVPVSALVESRRGSHPVYVAENHVVEHIPGAWFWLDAKSRSSAKTATTRFLGIGDPVYNTADPRLPKADLQPALAFASLFRLFAESPPPASLGLPRLVGTAAELQTSAKAWGGPATLLLGPESTGRNLAVQLVRLNPAIVHVAAHFLRSRATPAYGLMALSVTAGQTELVSPMEISHWRTNAELVVLSGCHSAAGPVVPGAGLLGLTRAWLAAGAKAVIATRWDIPDDAGDAFSLLYGILRNQDHPDPALALAEARRQMIRSGGWRARPRYWGAYSLVGNE
jgi:CHAT domain-containing protein